MTVFVLLWTVELFLVQRETLTPPDRRPRFFLFGASMRFLMDLAFIVSLTALLGRKLILPVLVGSLLVYLGLITYEQQYGRSISLLTMLNQYGEGLAVTDAVAELVPRNIALLLVAVLAAKLALLWAAGRAQLSRQMTWTSVAVLVYVALFASGELFDPLRRITVSGNVGRMGFARGYLGAWSAEWLYLNDDALAKRAIQRRSEVRNGITPVENPIPIQPRLVLIQVESLDTNVLGHRENGVEVTPFLNQLKNRSMYFRLRAIHDFGSLDADFAMLNGVPGSPDLNTWLIREYPYENTTPQIFAAAGYQFIAFHGNTGEFFNRRRPYEKLGMHACYFREEMDRDYDLKTNAMGISDQAVFDLSADLLEKSTGPTCHFIITLTTHTPFSSLSPEEQEIYPQPQTMAQRYANNMRYMDNCLRDYVARLGKGTTVFVYSDHPPNDAEGMVEDRDPVTAEEYIPCLIHDTDCDLSQVQRTRGDARSTDGTWSLLDAVNYLRAQVSRSSAKAEGHRPASADQAAAARP